MPDAESQFLDVLYLGVRDLAEFDHGLTLLCGLFEVNSVAPIDFDAARPEVSSQSAVGLFSGEVAERYEREFAHLDPAPPAFMKPSVGTAIPTYGFCRRRRTGLVCSSASSFGRSALRSASAARWRQPMAALL